MTLVGFNLMKIQAERKKQISGKVEIKTDINVLSIKKEDIEMIKNKDVLSFNFEFSIDYFPEIAKIVFEGEVLLALEQKETKEVLNKWKKKEMEEELKMTLYNIILTRCNVKALTLEEEMNLFPHIPLPRFSKQPAQEQKK